MQFEEQYIVFLQASSYRHSNVHPILFAFACRLCSFMLISSRFVSHIFKSYRHTAYVALITTEIFFFFADGIRRLVHCYTICIKKKKIILGNDTLHLLRIVVHEEHNKFTVLFDSCHVQC